MNILTTCYRSSMTCVDKRFTGVIKSDSCPRCTVFPGGFWVSVLPAEQPVQTSHDGTFPPF